MGFNYGLEKRKFTEEWKKLYSEYKAAGMSEEDIQDIYAFDLNVFRKNRTEFQRTQPLSESSCDDGIEQGESMSALLKKFSSALSVCDKYSFQSDPRFAWVDEMENDELYRRIISLPERDIYAHLDYRSKISSAQAMEQGMLLPRSDDFGSRWENVTEQGKITEPDLNPVFD